MFDSQICRASFYGRDENTVAMSHSSSEPSLKVSSSQRSRGWGASVRCKPHLQSQFAAWCFSESVPTPRAPPASAQLWASGLIYVDGLTLNHNVSSCWRCTLCRCQQETLTREELWISCQWLLLLGGQWSDWLSEVAGEGEGWYCTLRWRAPATFSDLLFPQGSRPVTQCTTAKKPNSKDLSTLILLFHSSGAK